MSENWMMVRVTGFGKVLRMIPADVFATTETAYQIQHISTSCGLTGAFSASAISCAPWLRLALLPLLMFRMASLKLLCLV